MKIKVHMLNSVLLVLMFTVANPLWATDYYVDQNHPVANDQNTGTIDRPWKTIAKANTTLVAGDTAYIKAGTYTGTSNYINPSNSGSASQLITYRNYGTDTVTISSGSRGIRISGKSYINVTGINFYDLDESMYLISGASNNTISYCTFDSASNYVSWSSSIIYQNSSYNWIHHCTFHDYGYCDSGHGSGSGQGTLLDIGNEESGTDNSSYNVIENSTFYHGGHHVLGIFSKYNTVRNNYLHNEAWMIDDRGGRNLYSAGYAVASGYTLYEGNRFGYATKACNNSIPTLGSAVVATDYNIFRYNKLFHNVAYAVGLSTYGNPPYGRGAYNKIYNNTMLNSGYNIDSGYAGGQEDCVIYFASSQSTGNLVKNNLYYLYNTTYSINTSGQTFANNWAGDTQGDPKFVNASGTPPSNKTDGSLPNLDLQSSSPAIDKGGALTTVTSATGSGTSITVANAGYFQDGTYGPPGVLQADWIAVGTIGNVVRISSISGNTINLANSISWTNGASVWLYKKSDGVRVLSGTAPDAGAYEFSQAQAPSPPKNLKVISP